MSVRTFVSWVEPMAAALAEGRQQVIAFAREAPAELWSRPSELKDWTCKDVLAHLAGDSEKVSLAAMRAAVTRRAPAPTFADGHDAVNARDIEERRDRSVEELVGEIEADGREWEDLLQQLNETDEDVRWAGFPLSIGEYLRLLVPHDPEHLAQMRTPLET